MLKCVAVLIRLLWNRREDIYIFIFYSKSCLATDFKLNMLILEQDLKGQGHNSVCISDGRCLVITYIGGRRQTKCRNFTHKIFGLCTQPVLWEFFPLASNFGYNCWLTRPENVDAIFLFYSHILHQTLDFVLVGLTVKAVPRIKHVIESLHFLESARWPQIYH